jgi:hypothetical protein
MRKHILLSNYRLWPRPWDFPLGSLESRAAARAVLMSHDLEIQEQEAALLKNATPVELALVEGPDNPLKLSPTLHLMCEAVNEKRRLFGLPPITPEYVRQQRKVLKEVEKIEQERAARGDRSFINREALRKMAEDRLGYEPLDWHQTGSTTAEAEEEEDDDDDEEEE